MDLLLNPKKNQNYNNLWNFWGSHWISFEDTIQMSMKGQPVSSTFECICGQIKRYSFETLMQRVNLTFIYGRKEVSNRDRNKLPCVLMEVGCASTTLDSFAYSWDPAENCVLTKFLKQNAKMLHYPLRTDRKEIEIFFVSEFNDTEKGTNVTFKVFPESYELCGKHGRLYNIV